MFPFGLSLFSIYVFLSTSLSCPGCDSATWEIRFRVWRLVDLELVDDEFHCPNVENIDGDPFRDMFNHHLWLPELSFFAKFPQQPLGVFLIFPFLVLFKTNEVRNSCQ